MSLTTDPITAAPDPETGSEAQDAKAQDSKGGGIDWIGEVKGIVLLLAAVLGFHSFIAKPFYIPSESMMPSLLVGDRLVVNKMSFGWSHVSPTIPSVPAFFKWLVMRQEVESLAVKLPEWKGRVWGGRPERGDIVILTPPTKNVDYIKRVIGLPGDRLEVRDGAIILNGAPIKRAPAKDRLFPVDANAPCNDFDYPGRKVKQADGRFMCRLPIVRETLPNGKSYDTIDMGPGYSADYFGPITIPEDHYFMMGDNRDHSADSRFPLSSNGLGGPVPWENLGGRAVIITFSLDGTSQWWNPLSWFGALRPGRAATSLAADKGTP